MNFSFLLANILLKWFCLPKLYTELENFQSKLQFRLLIVPLFFKNNWNSADEVKEKIICIIFNNCKSNLPSHRIHGQFFLDGVSRKSKNPVDNMDDPVRGSDVGFDNVSSDPHSVDGQGFVVSLVVKPQLK